MNGVAGFYIILSFFLFLRGLWNLFRAQSRIKERKKIENTAGSKAATAAEGYVELEGFAWPKAPPITTIRGGTAVYQEFTLEKIVGSGKHRRWKTVYSTKTSESFYLIDGTGLVEVVPTKADFALIEHGTGDWTSLDQAGKDRVMNKIVTEKVEGFPPQTFMFGLTSDSFRVSERMILVGSPLYARGSLARKPEPVLVNDFALATFASQALDFDIGKARNLNRLIDRDRDGKVSRVEAVNGYHTIAKSADQKSSPGESADPKTLFCFGTVKNKDQGLIIADCHQKNLLESVSSGNTRGIFWGSIQLSFGVLMIFAMFFPDIGVLLVRETVEYIRYGPDQNPTDKDRLAAKLALRKQIRSPKDCKVSPEICREIGWEFLGRTNLNPPAALAYFQAACDLRYSDACQSIASAAKELGISNELKREYFWKACLAGERDSCRDWLSTATAEEKPAAFQKLKTLPGETQSSLAIRDFLPVDDESKLDSSHRLVF